MSKLAKLESTIERLLDRLEGGEPGAALLDRLRAREAERDGIRAELARSAPARPILPSRAELEAIYRTQVNRLEDLLTGSDQMVEANALLRQLVGEVRVWGDPRATDGFRVSVAGDGAAAQQGESHARPGNGLT